MPVVSLAHGRSASTPCPSVPVVPPLPVVSTPPSPPIIPRPVVAVPSPGIPSVAGYVGINVPSSVTPRPGTSIAIPLPVAVSVSVPISVMLVPAVLLWWWWPWREPAVAIPGWSSPLIRVPRAMPIHSVAPTAIPVAAVQSRSGASSFGTLANSAALGSGRKSGPAVVELSTVKFVAVFKRRKVRRVGRSGVHLEIWVLKGVDGVDPGSPVKSEQLLEEGDGARTMPGSLLAFLWRPKDTLFVHRTYSRNLVERAPGLCRGIKLSAPGNVFQPGIFSSVGVPTRSQMISS